MVLTQENSGSSVIPVVAEIENSSGSNPITVNDLTRVLDLTVKHDNANKVITSLACS